MLMVKIGQKEFEYLEALETEEFYNGSSRRTLTVTCDPKAIGLDVLNSILTEANLASITMTNTAMFTDEESTEPITNIYDGYVLKLSCGIASTMTAQESPDSPAVYTDRLVFKLGKRTYIEQQLAALGISL